MSEFEVKTTLLNRDKVIEKIWTLGTVVDKWKDGSFNFEVYDSECADEMGEVLSNMDVEYKLL